MGVRPKRGRGSVIKVRGLEVEGDFWGGAVIKPREQEAVGLPGLDAKGQGDVGMRFRLRQREGYVKH